MARTHRSPVSAVLMLCLIGSQWPATLLASDAEGSASDGFSSSQTPTRSPSEAWFPTSRGLVAGIAVADNPGAKDVSSIPLTDRARPRFALTRELFTADPLVGSVVQEPGTFDVAAIASSAFAGQIYQGRPRRIRRERDGSIAAIVIGAVASITGAAILVYANRPECRSSHQSATGCGYGTKVVGGAVLSGGAVGLVVGALTWR